MRKIKYSSDFEQAFMAYYKDILPLYALMEDMEKSMHSSGMNYFRLPASLSKDNQDHYFYFKVDEDDAWEFYRFDDRQK